MMYGSHIIIDMIWVMAKISPNRPYRSYMKFSEDYVDLVENIIILITVALWEICCRMFSFLQIPEIEGY